MKRFPLVLASMIVYCSLHSDRVHAQGAPIGEARNDAYDQANALYRDGKYDAVLSLIERQEGAGPILDDRMFTLKGLSLEKAGKLDAAMKAFSAAIELAPKKALLYMNRGLLLCAEGACDRALEDLHKAVQLDPSATPPLFARARTFAALKKHEEAVADITAAIRLDTTVADFFLLLGQEQEALGDSNMAIVSYRKSLRRDSNMIEAHFAIGEIYRKRQDWPAAFSEYNAAINAGRRDGLIYFLRGSCSFFMKNYKASLADAKIANQLEPGVEPLQRLLRASQQRLGLPVDSFENRAR